LAVKLRLRRMGKKKQPIYKVVAADSRAPRDGKFLEAIGLYNPLTDPSTIEINEERAMYWLNTGAQPTATVKSLLSKIGILLRRDLEKRGFSEGDVNSRMDEWFKMQEAKGNKRSAKKTEPTPSPEPEQEIVAAEENNNTPEAKGAASDETTGTEEV
jgi:small subunit ribosomal protein S16